MLIRRADSSRVSEIFFLIKYFLVRSGCRRWLKEFPGFKPGLVSFSFGGRSYFRFRYLTNCSSSYVRHSLQPSSAVPRKNVLYAGDAVDVRAQTSPQTGPFSPHCRRLFRNAEAVCFLPQCIRHDRPCDGACHFSFINEMQFHVPYAEIS